MHVDPDELSLHALGEDVLDGRAAAHLESCGRCRSEVHAMRHTVSLARVADEAPAGPMLSSTGPAPRVWAAVAAELGLSAAATTAASTTAPAVRPARSRRVARPARWRMVAPVAVAASLGAVVATGATWAWLSREGAPPAAQLAAQLAPLTPGTAGAGQAQVVTGSGEGPALAVTVDQVPTTGGYLELWLIDSENGRMVSLGPVERTGTTATTVARPLPPGLDLTDYDVVDISDEPLDGDPLHSGVSLLRGTLA